MQPEHQQRYYDLGRTYWWLAGKYRVLQDVLARGFVPPRRPARVLDLGCGPGNMLDVQGVQGDAFGSDYSGATLRFCRERGYERLFQADLHDLPLRNGCFDVLEHLAEDRRAMGELARILELPAGERGQVLCCYIPGGTRAASTFPGLRDTLSSEAARHME